MVIDPQVHEYTPEVRNQHCSKSTQVSDKVVRCPPFSSTSSPTGFYGTSCPAQHSTTFGLTSLTYADDIAFLGDSFIAVQEAVNEVDRLAAVSGVAVFFFFFFFTPGA